MHLDIGFETLNLNNSESDVQRISFEKGSPHGDLKQETYRKHILSFARLALDVRNWSVPFAVAADSASVARREGTTA